MKIDVNKTQISEALERLRERLPEQPNWIALITIDGELIAGTKLTPTIAYREEERIGPIVNAFASLAERVHEELKLGKISSIYSVGKSGILLIRPLESNFIVALEYGLEQTVSQVSNSEFVFQNELKKLEELLGENPF